jgi:hydrogenase nickel incorporation protein HypA/HybF
MHEQSIVEALLATVLEKAAEDKASKILRIYIVAGELSGVVEDSVEFYFGLLGKGTIAEGASLFFSCPPTQVRCRNCATVYTPENMKFICPNCQGTKMEVISGRELFIESMEVENDSENPHD